MSKRRTSDKVIVKTNRVLSEIIKYFQLNGYSPTIRELSVRTGINSSSHMLGYLERLEEEGHIERERSVSRGIRLLYTAKERLLHVQYLGWISAGEPLIIPGSEFSNLDPESRTVEVPLSLLSPANQKRELFALQVKGDSMIDALVADRDYVILRPTRTAENGAMVAAWWISEEQTTLKYYFKEKDRIRLQPANAAYQPIFIDEAGDLEIHGVVVAVMRSLKQ
jgi:repressor LexA